MIKTISSKLQALLLSAGALASSAAWAVNDLPGGPAVRQLNLHPPVTKIAEAQHWLHWYIMIICIVIFLLVFGVMFYSVWKHRKSAGHKAQELAEPLWVEIGWTVVPFFIVIAMALPATKVLVAQKGAMTTSKAKAKAWALFPRST
jgi:cytochrome c oxidase subunit II